MDIKNVKEQFVKSLSSSGLYFFDQQRKDSILKFFYPKLHRKNIAITVLLANMLCTPYAMASTAADLGLSGTDQTLASGATISTATKLSSETIDHGYNTTGAAAVYNVYTGMYYHSAQKDGGIHITNDGTIDISASLSSLEDNFAAIYAVDDTTTVINNGTINAVVSVFRGDTSGNLYAYSSGIYADGSNINVLNNGSISITSTSTLSENFCVNVYGININGTGIVNNDGTITVVGSSEKDVTIAMGYLLYGSVDAANRGIISVSATAYKSATAVGIDAFSGYSTVLNSGTISAYANTTGSSTKAWAEGIAHTISPSITNTGTINATAESSTSSGRISAYGIVQEGNDSTSISNTGVINVQATNTGGGSAYAYQLYVDNGTPNVTTWAFTLGDYDTDATDSTINTIFGIDSDGNNAGLVFGDGTNGATFIVRADENTKYNTAYNVSDMVYIENSSSGTASGYIAEVKTELPFLVASLGTTSGGSSTNYADQTITLGTNINSQTSPGHSMTAQGFGSMQSHMHNLSTILANQLSTVAQGAGRVANPQIASADDGILVADSGHMFSDAGHSLLAAQDENPWRAFIMPYLSYTTNRDINYDTNMVGIATGASYIFNESILAGFHLNLGKAMTESAYLDSDALAVTLGGHVLYHFSPELYVRSHLSGYVSQSDNKISGTSGTSIYADVDTDSIGMFASLATGYDWALAPRHTITPELGLSYIYSKMDGYNVDYQIGGSSAGYALSYGDSDLSVLYAEASLRWAMDFDLGSNDDGVSHGTLKPTVRLGLRQALTDTEIASSMRFNGIAATTYSDANENAFVAEAGLIWEKDDIALSLSYTGDFGDVENTHMGMFKASFAF